MRKIATCIPFLLCGCSMAPDYSKPTIDTPLSWSPRVTFSGEGESTHEAMMSLVWWQQFKDPMLLSLLEEGLKANADLLLATSKIQQLRARYDASESGRAPSIKLDSAAKRISNSNESLFSGVPLSDKPYNDFSLSYVFSYEVDLWGRVTNKIEAAQAQLLSVIANRDAIRLSILSQIANSYFNLKSLDQRILIAENALRTREETLIYQEKQHRFGALDQLNLYQAQAEVEVAVSTLAELRQTRVEVINTLSILLGRTPRELVEHPIAAVLNDSHLPVLPILPCNLPSTLLERRPDLYAAEQDLIASNALVGVARADYFPTLSLSAIFGLGSSNLDKLLKASARTWQLQGGFQGPIFDLSVSARVNEALSQKDQAILTYKDRVVKAFKEVVDAEANQRAMIVQVAALRRQVAALRQASEIVGKRYREGYSTNLERLDTERSLFTAENLLAVAEKDQLIAAVTLAKALGGGWIDTSLKNEPQTVCAQASPPIT